jgi:hypothetical protein
MYSIWDHQEHLVAIPNLPINVPNVFQYMCPVGTLHVFYMCSAFSSIVWVYSQCSPKRTDVFKMYPLGTCIKTHWEH